MPFARSGGHTRNLEQCLFALTVQLAERTVEIILIVALSDVFVCLGQDIKDPLPSIPAAAAPHRRSAT